MVVVVMMMVVRLMIVVGMGTVVAVVVVVATTARRQKEGPFDIAFVPVLGCRIEFVQDHVCGRGQNVRQHQRRIPLRRRRLL